MGLAGKSATFMRRVKRGFHHFLALLLFASTLSAISIPTASAASGALTDSTCVTTVGETGSASIAKVGNDCVLTFTSGSNSWTVPANVAEADVLVVAGGGAGGGRSGGGGGAGGLVYLTNVTVTPATTISLSVGAGGLNGGAGTTDNGVNGGSGSDSTFALASSIVAKGGGGGGKNGVNGLSGGSGGGVGGTTTASETGGATTQGTQNIGFGFKGSVGSSGVPTAWTGGGGGGAGGIGGFGNTNGTGGSGGAGKSISITGSSVCYAAGGGGGISQTSSNAVGAGGACSGVVVGGAGSKGTATAGNGAANTGSGGGGSGFDGTLNGVPGDGGSGVVIVRWTIPGSEGAFPNISGMNARFNANNFNTTLNSGEGTWADTSGSGFHIAGTDIAGASTGAMSAQTSSNANGASNSFTVVQGTTASKITMLTAAEMTGKYTLFTVARYNGSAKQRIFQAATGTTSNHLVGFYNGLSGVYHKTFWHTAEAQASDIDVNNWLLSSECSYDPNQNATVNSCSATYSANGKQRSTATNTIESASFGIGINDGGYYTNQDSDYQIADVLVFNRVLTITEANRIETYLSKKYGIAIYSDLAANYDPGAAANNFTNGATITHGTVMKDLKKDSSDSLILSDSLDMSLYNGVTYSSSNGGVLNFVNGSDRYGQSLGLIRALPKFSASIWAKFSGSQTTGDVSTLVSQSYWAGGQIISPVIYYAPSAGAGKVGGGFYDGGTWRTSLGSGTLTTGVQATADTWAQYTVTFDGVNIAFYKNGVLQSSSAATQNPLRESYLRMATRWDGSASSYGFGGSIGVLRVYDHGLSQDEVTADYNSTAARYFVNTAAPTISGTIRAGQTLTASNGTWSGATITGYTYQWSRATTSSGTYSNISGATASTYVVADSDADKYLKVTVTASSSMGTLDSTSLATSIVTINCPEERTTGNGFTAIQIKYVGACIWKAPDNVVNVKVLLVGGGGGGGAWVGGGGGGGGVVENTSVTVSPGTEYNFFIGSGGTGSRMTAAGTRTVGTNGGDTTALGFTAYGGGLGGTWDSLGLSRATGGGGSYNNTVTSAYPLQGFSGGLDSYNWTYGYPTGGGGGAGAVGQAGSVVTNTSGKSGNGGAGKSTTITGSTLYFGGGGGGGCHGNATYPCTPGSGGSGGGGAGVGFTVGSSNTVFTGTAGTAFTGGGGGGSGAPSTNTSSVDSLGGAGGSGTIIIRIPGPATPTISSQPTGITKSYGQSTTLSVTATTSDGGTLSYQWKKDGTNIAGATSSSLVFNPIAMADSATYSVVVTNTFNGSTASVTSNNAILYVEALRVSTASAPTVTATTNTLKSISVSWTAVANADGYVVYLYRVADNVRVSFSSVPSGTSHTFNESNYPGIANNTSYEVSVLTMGSGNYQQAVSESPRTSVRTNTVYTVTYNYDNATGGNTTASADTISGGTAITLPTPTKTGFTFAGWYEASNFSGSALGSTYTPTQTLTIYAKWTGNSITVSYDSQGGDTVTATSTVSGGTISTAPTAPTRTGYTFSGWSATSSGSVLSFPYTHGRTADFTLYGIWAGNSLTVTYNAQGGSTVLAGSTVSGGTISTSPTPPTKTDYTFAGWSTTNGGSAITFPYTHGQTANFTLHALWTANVYTLTYVYNSASGGNSTVSDSFTTGGSQITLPTPTRTGYTFGGWYSDSGFTTLIGLAGASYGPTGSSLTPSAYAKWTANNYTVTYATTNSTGGTAPTDSTNYNIGNTVIIRGNTGSLARTGWTFTGWTAASDGTGTLLNSGSTVTTATSNMTFYPKWSANTYTVIYNKNGASGSPTATTATYTSGGTAVTLTTVGTMAKTGFDFGGWSATPTGSALVGTYTTSADVTLYAVWTIKSISITFSKGIAASETINNFPSNTALDYGSTLMLAGNVTSTVVISGSAYAFVGWSNGGNIYQGGATFLIGASAPTFTAEWVKIFAVRYAMNGGTAAAGSSEVDSECIYADGSDLRCTDAQQITTNAAPTRAGYTFAGWINQGGSAVGTAASTTISSTNYLFYATWTPVDYAITYNTAGGSTAPTSFTKRIGETFTTATAPTKPGYSFGGWSDSSTVLGASATYYVSTSPVTLTAQWVPNVYTVSYDWNGGFGTATSNSSYTVGNSAITLPLVGDHVKDGYSFSGWSETSNGVLISGGYTPTADITLYAIWGSGSYTVTYNANSGTVGTSSDSVLNGSSVTLPTPTRSNFVFEGWYTASSGGSLIGNAGGTFQPTSSRTIYARWTQSSLYGLSPSALTRIGTTTASSGSNSTFTSSNSTSSVSVTVLAGSLPNGTNVYFDLVGDYSRAQSVLTGTHSYVISLVVSWLATDGTVPNTASGKPISLTITNASIKAGMSIYSIVAGNVTLLGTATQDGTVTVTLTSDPEVVVAATKPNAPTSVAGTANGNKQAVVTWTAPSSDGGSAITSYTVTSNTGATCTSSNTSCTVTGLADATAYTFTVTATNALGTSTSSSASSSVTTATEYAVTFDSKGGSSVANGNFMTASTVAEPTAPTRAGYTFAGWSATDGGSAVSFPYAPGVTTNITLYGLWTALTHTVAFDSKGGSSVTSDTFLSGGSVSQPTAPTRTGYTFAGWSATDGGSVLTFPYTPGVVTAITLYAKWTQVAQSGGGGGSPSPAPVTPAPATPSEPLTPVKNNVTVAQPVTVIGDQDAKVTTIDISTSTTSTKPPTITLDSASKKFIADVKIVEGKLVLTPETGFSGKKTVTVTITENGSDRIVQIPLTVLPEAVTKPVVTPVSATKSIIRWMQSSNADAYTVFVDGKKVCSTSATSCSVSKILGPGAVIEVVSNGGDRTVSDKVTADFKQITPVAVTRLVSSTNIKSSLTSVDTKALDKVIALIKNQGFGTIVISNITTTKKTEAAAAARIAAIKKYIDAKTGSKEIAFEVVPAASRTYFNNISLKG